MLKLKTSYFGKRGWTELYFRYRERKYTNEVQRKCGGLLNCLLTVMACGAFQINNNKKRSYAFTLSKKKTNKYSPFWRITIERDSTATIFLPKQSKKLQNSSPANTDPAECNPVTAVLPPLSKFVSRGTPRGTCCYRRHVITMRRP